MLIDFNYKDKLIKTNLIRIQGNSIDSYTKNGRIIIYNLICSCILSSSLGELYYCTECLKTNNND